MEVTRKHWVTCVVVCCWDRKKWIEHVLQSGSQSNYNCNSLMLLWTDKQASGTIYTRARSGRKLPEPPWTLRLHIVIHLLKLYSYFFWKPQCVSYRLDSCTRIHIKQVGCRSCCFNTGLLDWTKLNKQSFLSGCLKIYCV